MIILTQNRQCAWNYADIPRFYETGTGKWIRDVTPHGSGGEVADHKIMDKIPDGWKLLKGASAAPNGMRWVCNGKSRFGGGYENALVTEKTAREWEAHHDDNDTQC